MVNHPNRKRPRIRHLEAIEDALNFRLAGDLEDSGGITFEEYEAALLWVSERLRARREAAAGIAHLRKSATP